MIRIKPSELTEAYQWFKRRHSIDLNPTYQRKCGLWSKRAKAFLIDSMINGFDIPKFYVADLALLPRSLRGADATHAVIDGKQRFETLFEWFGGELRLNRDFVYLQDPFVDAAGMTSRELSTEYPDLAAGVERFPLAVMNVVADHQEEINQLFIRLNQSQPLTGAETRNAMEGEAPAVIRRLGAHPLFADYVAFSTKRGGDLNTAAKILFLEFTGEFVDVKRRRLDIFVKEIAKEGELTATGPPGLRRAASVVDEVFTAMTRVFRPKDRLLRTQGPVPVYYWLIREVGAAADVREFLEDFEKQRAANQQLIRQVGAAGPVDVELLQYDQFSRSVNDQHSLRGRYEILRRRYLRSRGRSTSAA